MAKKKRYNVRKAVFTCHKYDGATFTVEIVGKMCQVRHLIFFKKWVPEYVNPDKIIAEWGRNGFIKIGSREYLNMDTIEQIKYRTKDHFMER